MSARVAARVNVPALVALLLALFAAPAPARAADAPAAPAAPASAEPPPPAIDVRDLPPLPDVEFEEKVGSVAVVSASLAEEEIVVGAAKREQSLGNVASAVTVISGDRLRRLGYRNVGEALRAVAGLYVVDDRMSQRLGIRGLQLLGDFNTRILVLVDGATVNEPWNQFAGVGYDMPVHIDEIARIEVIRGPVSSVYGTNAFFGIINIVTRSADQSPRTHGRLEAGAFGTWGASAGFATGTVHRQVRGHVFYRQRAGESVTIPADGGPFETSADGLENVGAALVAHWDGAFAQVRVYRHVRELTGAPYDTAIGDRRNRNVDAHLMAEGGFARDLGERFTLTVRGYLNRYQFRDYLVYEPDPNFQDVGDAFWVGAEVRGRFALLDRQRLGVTTGVEASFDDVKSHSFEEGDAGIEVPTTFDVQGVYAEVDAQPFRWLAATAGVRLDRNSAFTTKLSPRFAIFAADGDRYGAKLLYSEGFRNPSALEAFFEDNLDFVANPALRPEEIASWEAVVWWRPRPGFNLRASGFRWELRDMIEQEQVDTPDGPRLQYQNIFAMTSTGLELESSYRDTRGWLVFGAAALAIVDRDGSTEDANNAPRLTASLGGSTPRLFGRVHVSTELLFVDARRTRGPVEADAWVGWNAAVHVPDWRGFDLTIGARNLLGVREEVPAQEDYDRDDGMTPVWVIPGAGREIYARLGYRY